MELDIGGAIEEGARRTVERNGLLLVAAFFLLNLISAFTGVSAAGSAATAVAGNPLLLGVVGVTVSVISIAVSIVALRVFVTGETEVVPDTALKRNMGLALLHTIVGSLLFALLVTVGIILLVVPGIYIILALFFWTMYVAVEDQGFYEAMQSSWELTKTHKWRLLGLLLVIVAVNVGLGLASGLLSTAGGGMVRTLVLEAGRAFGGVFALAVQARAYTQLAGR